MFENSEMEVEDGAKEDVKNCKVKGNRRAKNDRDVEALDRRLTKRILLSLAKPSYTLGLGGDNVRAQHRNRLRYILSRLVRRHNWEEASGVLSVLLKATTSDKSPAKNRIKYGVALEILRHTKSDFSPTKFQHIYEFWMKKIGSMKMWPTKDRFVVQLEFILFCLGQGDLDDAYQAVLSLMQEREFAKDPISNLVVGLTFYQLWYSTIPEELQLRDFDESCAPVQSEMSWTSFNIPDENSEGHNAVDVHEANSTFKSNSDTSVRNDKVIDHGLHVNDSGDSMEVVGSQGEMTSQNFHPQGFYMHSADDSSQKDFSFGNPGDYMSYASILHARGLNAWLLPLRLSNSSGSLEDFNSLHKELTNDYYKGAVKHLRLALYMTPPVCEALLPLIQMLLLGNRVKEALDELEKFSDVSESALLLRMKASLLESSDRGNSGKISTCFEDILKKDPTCSHSLSKLISMHHNGDYNPEGLLEMIALHLDASYAECNTWREFASCFLKLSHCEEDRMSVCLNGTEGGSKHGYSVCFKRVPKIFTEGISGKAWRFRCRWWLSRHFSPNIFNSETAAGDLHLVTYKAAVASHIYGQAFEYVVKAYTFLEDNDREMLLFLQMHMQNSAAFYSKFNENHRS